MSMFSYDDESLIDIVNQYNEMFDELAKTPLKITYTDYTGVTFNSTTQSYEGNTPEEKTLYKKCAYKIGKKIGEDGSSILLDSIPHGSYGVYLKYADRLDINSMNEQTKKSLKFELYYDSESPIKLNPEEQVANIQYIDNEGKYPVHQVFICGVEK